jgi:glycosyltransferase involved in cell wall biosynthesis
LTLHLWFRHPRPGFHSIETVFGALIPEWEQEMQVVRHEVPTWGGGPAAIWRNGRYARQAGKGLHHVTGAIHPLVLFLRGKVVLTIHDTGSILQTRNPLRWLYFWLLWLALPVARAHAITVISEASRREVVRWVPWAAAKIHVVPNPVASRFAFRPRPAIGEVPRILQVGTKPNKNLERVTRALRGVPCQLEIIGKLSSHQQSALEEAGIRFQAHADVSESEIVAAYQRADLLVFASTYEGFGMPILEAQACGCPIVTSDWSPMREVAGKGAHLIDPTDVAAIRAGIMRILQDTHYANQLVEAGQLNVQQYQPAHIASQYRRIYESLFSS